METTEWGYKQNKKTNSTFKTDGQEICDPTVITNKFSQYFTNIGLNLAMRITSTVTCSHTDYIEIFPNLSSSTQLQKKKLSTLPAHSNRVKLLDMIKSHRIATPLTRIIDLPITHGVLPNENCACCPYFLIWRSNSFYYLQAYFRFTLLFKIPRKDYLQSNSFVPNFNIFLW